MFERLRNRVLSAVSPDLPALSTQPNRHTFHGHASSSRHPHFGQHHKSGPLLPDKFPYARPAFLQLCTVDELRASADHNVRPIIVPRDVSAMPWNAGYAECVNSGKSEWNEDQSAFQRHVLVHPLGGGAELPYIYFGTFDGHAGFGAALAAANQFQHILHEKLVDVIEMLIPAPAPRSATATPALNGGLPHPQTLFQRTFARDELIVGALESAFAEMDALLAEDRDKYRNAGGCTALVSLFILGKMFVANAGDSRAVLCRRRTRKAIDAKTSGAEGDTAEADDEQRFSSYALPCSFDHTPDTERPRLLSAARINPALLGGEYVAMEYAKRPQSRDLGTRIMYRQGQMRGWAYKTLTPDDLRMPLVTGEGKRSRLLGTIGVTRGFGDHDLRALYTQLLIKPFLSPHPDVRVWDLSEVESVPSDGNADGEYGVLIMATDGLWDVSEPENVARSVFETLDRYPQERHRYTMVAQDLVAKARGKINESGHWRLADTRAAATVDDISVTAVPVHQYYEEWRRWEREREAKVDEGRASAEAERRRVSVAEESVEVDRLMNGIVRMGRTDDGEETIAVELEVQENGANVAEDELVLAGADAAGGDGQVQEV